MLRYSMMKGLSGGIQQHLWSRTGRLTRPNLSRRVLGANVRLTRFSQSFFCSSSSASGDGIYDEYRHPLITRYASKKMRRVWSEKEKFATWRRLWTALAKAQMELNVPGITNEIVNEMNDNIYNIDFDYAKKQESILRHDVMAHIHTFAKCLSSDASKIIHYGATSCYVQDNGDLYLMKKGIELLLYKLLKLIEILSKLSIEHSNVACLGYTHLQAAQLTTVGKRLSLYLQDFYMDYMDLNDFYKNKLSLRGAKGTTGTQASFLKIFDGNGDKVDEMESKVVKYMGFDDSRVFALTGQTYPRKLDYQITSILSGIGQSVHKMATDIRLLSSFGEIEEPFESKQVGSSAMAYKRNPMRSERACSLARYLINIPNNNAFTQSTQWLERSLDDSANRRIVIPESFLCCDAILDLSYNILNGINVCDVIINKRINDELAFMATENILMECVKKGGDRQELHELIRVYSNDAIKQYKEVDGNASLKTENLLNNIKTDKVFGQYLTPNEIDDMVQPSEFIGRAPQQVASFVATIIDPLLKQNQSFLKQSEFDDATGTVQV